MGSVSSMCYHDTSEGTWALVQDITAETGFLADRSGSAIFIDADQKSIKQITADKVSKRNLVINFRKPPVGQLAFNLTITGDEDETTFQEKARMVIRDYLMAQPGSTKDRVYDELVSHLVRSGQMEPHNFDALLQQVAEPVQSGGREAARWFLKETEASVVDAAESSREDMASTSVRHFMESYREQNPEVNGVHYSDLFEHYVYAVPTKEKPRRQLADWLTDYFFKTDSGTYRLPETTEEEQLKAQGRANGTGRRIKRYLSFLQQGVAVPEKERPNDLTLAEWIRHCRRSGLYEQGRILFERGGLNPERLSDEAQVELEEDYEVCVRMLSRARDQKQQKPARAKAKPVRSSQESSF